MNRNLMSLAAVVGLVLIYSVVAQERPSGGGVAVQPQTIHNHHYYGGAPGGYGNAYVAPQQRGLSGGLATGVGELRLSTAEAAEAYAQTAGQVTENHNYAVQSYYGNKDEHDEYVAAHMQGPPSEETLQKRAKLAGPGRLSSTEYDRTTNVINWPALLRESEFTAERQKLDHLFHDRSASESGVDSPNYVEIRSQCHAMLKTLGEKLRREKLPAPTFIAAEHFIRSLEYEGTFSAQ